jgi:hypothetical protein
MSNQTNDAVAASADSLRAVLTVLEDEENRLAGELATIKAKRTAVAKAVDALADSTPKRRRGRPRKSAANTPAEAVAA